MALSVVVIGAVVLVTVLSRRLPQCLPFEKELALVYGLGLSGWGGGLVVALVVSVRVASRSETEGVGSPSGVSWFGGALVASFFFALAAETDADREKREWRNEGGAAEKN